MPGSSTGTTAQARCTDADNHCYGLAFVLLAYAHALMAGVEEARGWITRPGELMEQRFWEEGTACMPTRPAPTGSVLDPYRGQNANMHACEALLAAFAPRGTSPTCTAPETAGPNITQRQAARVPAA
jgi:mannose/cellobiose epimerase-like protein (N-acyl-D-glucosamine 2-epimerase family)